MVLNDLCHVLTYIEFVFGECCLHSKRRVIGNFYRPPNGDVEPFLFKLYGMLLYIQKKFVFHFVFIKCFKIFILKLASSSQCLKRIIFLSNFRN